MVSERLKEHDKHLRLLDNTLKISSGGSRSVTLDDTAQDLVETSIYGQEEDQAIESPAE